ncbi:hypothetical protein ACO0R3_000197 [Hanseniaspora guilliermondii]
MNKRNIQVYIETCKKLLLNNAPSGFDEYISEIKDLYGTVDNKQEIKSDFNKCFEYYARYLLKNRSNILNFPKRYYETCKYIINTDFIKGYYYLLVLTKCLLDIKNRNANSKYIDKCYLKFTNLLDKTKYEKTETNTKRIAAIKNTYKKFSKKNCDDHSIRAPIKRFRDLAQEDMTKEDLCFKADLKKYKAMLKEPKLHIPKFLYHLPDHVNMKIISHLTTNDILELRCLNSLVNNFFCGMYLYRLNHHYNNIMINNDESFGNFLKLTKYLSNRQAVIERITFDFDCSCNDKKLTINLRAIQMVIHKIKVKELYVINHEWTILNLLPLNIVGKDGHTIEFLSLKISKIINETYRFLENSFILFTCPFLLKLSIEYINMVYIKEVATFGIKADSQNIQCYDGSILKRQRKTTLKKLEVISFLDIAMFPLLNKYTKNKVFMDLFIKFDEIFEDLQEITLRNFSIYNMKNLFTYITKNPLKITKLELLRIPALPKLPRLFLVLKDLCNLKTFSLHGCSSLEYTFTSINNFILINNIYDTNTISDEFLERFMIVPSWPKLEELTLIETSINKPILQSLLTENIKFLCLNNNINLKYMPIERVFELNTNMDIPKFFITSFDELHLQIPNIQTLSLNKLDFDMHSTYLTHITNSFFSSLFKMDLETLDVTMNQGFCMRLYDFLKSYERQSEIEDLKVKNLIYDDFFNNDHVKAQFVKQMKSIGLVYGTITNKLKQFRNDNEYVCWYRSCVLEKYKSIQ